MDTEAIDKLYLELSQFTRATTSREHALLRLSDQLGTENGKMRDLLKCVSNAAPDSGPMWFGGATVAAIRELLNK